MLVSSFPVYGALIRGTGGLDAEISGIDIITVKIKMLTIENDMSFCIFTNL